MSQTTMSPAVASKPLGSWVTFWHVLVALAATAWAYWALQNDAIATLRELASDKTYFKAGHPLLFDSQVRGYSLEEARALLGALGNTASYYYADTYLALYDILFPLAFMVFGILFVLWATHPHKGHALVVSPLAQWLMLAVPVAVFVFDMSENLLIYTMIEAQQSLSAKVVETASMFTQLKWLAVLADGMMLAGLGAFTAHRVIEGDRKR